MALDLGLDLQINVVDCLQVLSVVDLSFLGQLHQLEDHLAIVLLHS